MPLSMVILLIALVVSTAAYCFFLYQKHILGINAQEKNIDIRILDKQSTPGLNPQREEEYWIYVEPLSGGPKREFQIGIHYYHAIQPGDCGNLSYKGISFLSFAKFQRSN